MARDTKERILRSALSNFNEMGYFNVRLQHISDSADMSVGNMVYHFQHKKELFSILFKKWKTSQDFILADIHLTPIFKYFDSFLEHTYNLQHQYRFLFLDQLELIRMSPEIGKAYQEYFQHQQDQLEILLALYQARGSVDWKDQNAQLVATKIRRIIDNWLIQQFIEGQKTTSLTNFQLYIWSEIQPYFTISGQAEFEEKNMQTTTRTG